MFDIGFTELLLVGVVGLLVIGPERLPGAIRTASLWLNRLKRGFNDIKREVQQELHNDEVMQELRKTGQQLKSQADEFGQNLQNTTASLSNPVPDDSPSQDTQPTQATDKRAE
jgi:sec-independent protein translocase protein TatB